MEHFDQVQSGAVKLMEASEKRHHEAWMMFSAKVYFPPRTAPRIPRRDSWPLRGLRRTKRQTEESEDDEPEGTSRKRMRLEEEGEEEEEEEEGLNLEFMGLPLLTTPMRAERVMESTTARRSERATATRAFAKEEEEEEEEMGGQDLGGYDYDYGAVEEEDYNDGTAAFSGWAPEDEEDKEEISLEG